MGILISYTASMYNIEDFRKVFGGRKAGIQGARKYSAVLVGLSEEKGETRVLYEVRSSTIERQPGEVCFPGGEVLPGEDPVAGALRETTEELGIASSDIDVIAPLDLYVNFSGDVIYPVLAELKPGALDALKLNKAEVAEAFLVPLPVLLKEPWTYSWLMPAVGPDFPYEKIGFKGSYPWRAARHEVISWEYQGHFIWGMTAQITKWLLSLFVKAC
jgi:8-oxo-dGTP pyrophosphatase MutT (NUDIX family)